MAWRQTVPTGIITSIRSYVEKKAENAQELMRVRISCVVEYRGMTYTAAKLCVMGSTSAGTAVAYANGSDESEMQPIGAGGWNVVRTIDWSPLFTWTRFTANLSFTIP